MGRVGIFRGVLPLLAAALLAALLFFVQFSDEAPLFAGAQRYHFYTRSADSQACIVCADAEEAARVRRSLFGRTGESAVFADAEEALSQAERYGARLLFSERAGDVTNYYYYSPHLGGCVYVAGRAVNLHVALRGEGGCVGSPLIFGGY